MNSNKRVDGLNFIRIMGMTMILLFHARLMYGFHIGVAWLDRLISIGAVFVTVFFMLSGFGLRKGYRDLAVSNRSDMLAFYKKRILSFYPLFLLLTVVALVFRFRVADTWTETLLLLPIQLSGIHVVLGKGMHSFLFNDNCWYISALFVLYLLFPFLNRFVEYLSLRVKICLCVVFWLLSWGIYAYLVYGTNLTFLDYYTNPFLRIPEFMIGMMLADVSEEVVRFKWLHGWVSVVILGIVAVCASIALIWLYPWFGFETNLYDILVIPCTAIYILCIAGNDGINSLGKNKVIRAWAGLGLEIYLCQSFATLVLTHVKADAKWDEWVFIALSVLFAVGVHYLLNKMIKKNCEGLGPRTSI